MKIRLGPPSLKILLLISVAIAIIVIVHYRGDKTLFKNEKTENKQQPEAPSNTALPADSWRFIVSGDSRNCGDLIMPAIAAHSAKYFQPAFYWHLGDLRAIYMVDEDMAFADETDGHKLACTDYVKRAWPDFIEHQIYPFGKTPFYIGIGNHEVIPPMDKPPADIVPSQDNLIHPEIKGAQFTSRFADWLLAPAIKEQRLKDRDCDSPSTANQAKPTGKSNVATKPCLIYPRNYYHWVQGGVDFIYLDNASNVFGKTQLDWFKDRVAKAQQNADVRSLVVGMHEALPDSISSDHAMCDDGKKTNPKYPYAQSCAEGREAYKALLDFQDNAPDKHVYLLASHSHYFMDGTFNKLPVKQRIRGWIVGTAGAVRYSLPDDKDLSNYAKTDTYGYLVGTVDKKGNIQFEFQRLSPADLTGETRKRYSSSFVSWCFDKNSENKEPKPPKLTNQCLP